MEGTSWADGASMDSEAFKPFYNTSLGFIYNSSSLGTFLTCDGATRPLAPQHLLFNLANAFFLISYLAPSNRRGLLFMHSILIIGFLLYSTWAWNVICASDIFSWNFSCTLLNMGQTLYILYQMRPVSIKKELEPLYLSLFEPLHVPRISFKRLVSPEFAQTMSLHAGEAYALTNLTKTDRLGLLIEGKASVFSSTQYLHSISPMEFLDSPEYESSRTCVEDKFRVSVVAVTSCRYVYWQRASLEFFFVKEPYMSTIMATLIARDITTKLYSMNHKIVTEKGSQLDIRLPSLTSSLSSSVGDTLSTKSPLIKRSRRKLSLAASLPVLENRSLLSLKISPDMSRLSKTHRQRRSTTCTPTPPSHRPSGFQKLQNNFSKGLRPLSTLKHPLSSPLSSPYESQKHLNNDRDNREPLLERGNM